MKHLLLLFPFVLLFSCSPKVSLVVVKSYPARNLQDTVHVYEHSEDIPKPSEVLAKIAVYDAGAAIKCNYNQVLAIAQKEVLKLGGNGLLITNHTRPSILGSTCHQIQGNILRVGELKKIDSLAIITQSNILPKIFIEPKRPENPPTHNFDLNMGYGWVYNRTKNLTGAEKQFEDALSNGITWDLQYSCFLKSFLGFGAIYSGYASSGTFQGETDRILLTYLAPMVCIKSYQSKSWILKCNIGVGFLGYLDHLKGTDINATAATLGTNIGMGIEYQVNSNWGIGVEVNSIMGSFKKITYHYSNYTEERTFDNNQKMGVSRIDMIIGLRYYIH